jgi:hypothetical protein
MNYGHQASHNPYDSAQVAADLGFLKSMGVTKLRIAYPTFDAPGLSAIQSLVQTALTMDFYVVWGTTATGGTPVSNSRWAIYKNFVVTTLAPWAQALGNPNLELAIGNEEELHCDGTTLTVSTVVADLGNLATAVQAIYTAGAVSYQSPIPFLTNWASQGLGGLDRIGFNAYSFGAGIAVHANSIVAAFPGTGYLSEWGTPNGFTDFKNESIFNFITKKQIAALKATSIPDAYYFCYRDGSFGLPANAWAIKMTDGNFRQAAPALFGVRAWFRGSPNVPLARNSQLARVATKTRTASVHRPG